MTRPVWDFDYRPVHGVEPLRNVERDLIVATWDDVQPTRLEAALNTAQSRVHVDPELVRPPFYWFRVWLDSPLATDAVHEALCSAGIGVRYVTSSIHPNQMLGPRPEFSRATAEGRRPWPTRPPTPHREVMSPGRWFIDQETGVGVDRVVCGYGAGTRLAVIDDEGGDVDALDLDEEVLVGVTEPPRGSSHGATIVAWAVGSRGRSAAGIEPFLGVAPDASPRLYLIPKPGRDLVSLARAIVRAVDDGADAAVCATHIEGTTSPLLDDALEYAVRVGRGGLGMPVIFPAGREVSSPPRSVHASLSLSFCDPASDLRVLCIGPSGRTGGWFLWADKLGNLRPFANRGPAVRLAAPGDDIAYPFARDHRLGHAESSGAAAIASGVVLLVLATNPELRLEALYGLMTDTAVISGPHTTGPIADSADLLPAGNDADGHDVKCGYGRISALRACLAAADPIAGALVEMGDLVAARRYVALRKQPGPLAAAYSEHLARWAANVARADAIISQGVRMLLRHLRLASGSPDRRAAHGEGALARALALVLDRLRTLSAPSAVQSEIDRLNRLVVRATGSREASGALETVLFMLASELWGAPFEDRADTTIEADSGHRLAS